MQTDRLVSQSLYRFFYWTAIAMTLACVALVLATNSEFLNSWPGPGIPWSWVAGIAAILAFIAAEFCEPGHKASRKLSPAGQLAPLADTTAETIYQEI